MLDGSWDCGVPLCASQMPVGINCDGNAVPRAFHKAWSLKPTAEVWARSLHATRLQTVAFAEEPLLVETNDS